MQSLVPYRLAIPREKPDAELALLELTLFELADTTGAWQPAKAVIDGQTIVVTSAQVPSPVAVRYAYSVTPASCNLYNRDGLPAAPFCSDPDLLVYDPRLPK